MYLGTNIQKESKTYILGRKLLTARSFIILLHAIQANFKFYLLRAR